MRQKKTLSGVGTRGKDIHRSIYLNGPKLLDRWIWAKSTDHDQSAPLDLSYIIVDSNLFSSLWSFLLMFNLYDRATQFKCSYITFSDV